MSDTKGRSRITRLPWFLSSVFESLFRQNQKGRGGEQEAMSSREQAVIHQKKRAGGTPMDKPKAGAGADGKSRRALGDIGNVVDSRTIGRSSGVPIFGKAQGADAATAGDKKSVGTGATFKPKPEIVTETIPDTYEKTKQTSAIIISSRSSKSSRKKVHTFTSPLTSPSKSVCEIADKSKDRVDDIDASDADDPLAVTDYVEDIYKFYKLAENSRRPHKYMGSQAEINENMRSILADWLIKAHNTLGCRPETLYLAFYIVDRYLSMETVPREELQLVGVSAVHISCKYEDSRTPEVNDLLGLSDGSHSNNQLLAMEKRILNSLEWNLTVPTPYVFLVRFLKAASSDKEMEHMVFFFAELGLMEYSMISYCPSMFAAAAVYAARCTLKKTPLWTRTLEHHTGFSEFQLWDCARVLVGCHSVAPESILGVVYWKYSNPLRGAVALHPPATKLLEELKASTTCFTSIDR